MVCLPISKADVNVDAVFDNTANNRMGLIIDALPNCNAIFTAEELTATMHEELYGGGTSDKTTSSSEVLWRKC